MKFPQIPHTKVHLSIQSPQQISPNFRPGAARKRPCPSPDTSRHWARGDPGALPPGAPAGAVGMAELVSST